MKKIINTICDLKTQLEEIRKIEEVQVNYPNSKEVIEDILGEIKEKNLYFSNGEELKNYLAYLLDRKQYNCRGIDIETTTIKCTCETVWKICYEPEKKNLWDSIGSFEYEESGMERMLREHMIAFKCSVCKRDLMILNARTLHKLESVHIPPKPKYY